MASVTKTTSAPSVAGATTALVLLTALNFVNYIDRYILPGVQEQIKVEFHLSDEHIGTLTFWFMIAYMLTSPLTGWLGDRFPRKPMIVIAALLWSGVNFFTASVHPYDPLNLSHAAVTFSLGGISWWMPSFLQRIDGRSQSSAAYLMGIITLIAGLGGTVTGGFIAQRWSRTNSKALYLVPGISAATAVPPALLCFF